MQPFVQHSFKNTIKSLSKSPVVIISENALKDMQHIVNLSKDEIGWLGTVYRRKNGFYIEEVFILQQTANSTTCEITEDGLTNLALDLMKEEKGVDKVNALRFWGHSHVNMGTSPSAQDEGQIKALLADVNDFFIRGILNKKGRMELDLYDLESKLCIFDIKWASEIEKNDEREKFWANEIKQKVKKDTPIWAGGYHSPAGFNATEGLHENIHDMQQRRLQRWQQRIRNTSGTFQSQKKLFEDDNAVISWNEDPTGFDSGLHPVEHAVPPDTPKVLTDMSAGKKMKRTWVNREGVPFCIYDLENENTSKEANNGGNLFEENQKKIANFPSSAD